MQVSSRWVEHECVLLPSAGNIHMFSNVARDAHYYPRRHRAERAWTQEPEEEEHRPQVPGAEISA